MTIPHKPSVFCLLPIIILLSSCNGNLSSDAGPETAVPLQAEPSPDVPFDPFNDPSLISQYVRTIFHDTKGNYWFGPTTESVARYDGKTLKYFSADTFFRGNENFDPEDRYSVHAATEDSDGNLWFGTDIGVIKHNGSDFKNYTNKEGLDNLKVGRGSIIVDRSGVVWVGTAGGVFRSLPSAAMNAGQSFTRFNLIPETTMGDIMKDSAGNIWFASREKGVFRYDGETVKNFTFPVGIGRGYAGGIAEDNQGNIWFTTAKGICRYDGKTFLEYTTDDGIGGSEIWGLIIEPSGIVWITARGATTRFDPSLPIAGPDRFKVFTPSDGLNCCVQSMHLDHSGNLLLGSGEGVYRFDGKAFYKVRRDGPW